MAIEGSAYYSLQVRLLNFQPVRLTESARVAGFEVYEIVTISPKITGLISVRMTLVPDIATEVTALSVPFTLTIKSEGRVPSLHRE